MAIEVRQTWAGHRGSGRIVNLSVNHQEGDIFVVFSTANAVAGLSPNTFLGSSDSPDLVENIFNNAGGADGAGSGIIRPVNAPHGNTAIRVEVGDGSAGAGYAVALQGWNPDEAADSDNPRTSAANEAFGAVTDAAQLGGLYMAAMFQTTAVFSSSDMTQLNQSTDAGGNSALFSLPITLAHAPTMNANLASSNGGRALALMFGPRANTGSGVIWFQSVSGWADRLKDGWEKRRGIMQPTPGWVPI